MSKTARRGSETAQCAGARRLAAAAWAVLGLLALGPAQEPASATIGAPLTAAAELLLGDADAELRGEAALVLAHTKDQKYYTGILKVAKDPAPAAKIRGLVALGILAAPGSETYLGEVLEDSRTRPKPEGMAAALALGLLPANHPAPALTVYLTWFRKLSYRRQRDVLGSMLVGMSREPHPDERVALFDLLDDAANKDGGLRALIIGALGEIEDGISDVVLRDLLDHGRVEERAAMLNSLARTGRKLEELDLVERLCQRDRSPEVRAAALAYLTACRHLPALDLAARALRSNREVEVAQAVRSTVQLGGGAIRTAMERHILESGRPTVQAAMLAGLPPPYSDDFVESCFRLAVDRRKTFELRREAALLVARSGEERIAPVLRSLFLDTEDPRELERLAVAILEVEASPPGLDRLNPAASAEDVKLLPARIRALLHARHPDVEGYVLAKLGDGGVDATTKAGLLRSWRLARHPQLDPALIDQLPEHLAAILR